MLALVLALVSAAFADAVSEETMLFYLTFDEGIGSVIHDASGRLPDGDVRYQYLTPAYTEPMDPQWRNAGVDGGTLLFDGCSTCVEWPASSVCLAGRSLTVSVWVAPRTFEWDDTNAAEQGNAHLTAILGQYYKAENQGLLLGYQRFGRPCVEVPLIKILHHLKFLMLI